MARDHGRVLVSIWSDESFRDLTPLAQHLYLMLTTDPSLSYVGVADWRPRRILPRARTWTLRQLESAASELMDRLYVLVDVDTEEVLVRSFVRNDGLMKQRHMGVSMARAYNAVASNELRGVIVHELVRLRSEAPSLKGWGSDEVVEVLSRRSIDPSSYPLGHSAVHGEVQGAVQGEVHTESGGEVHPSSQPPSTPSPSPTPYSLLPTPGKTASTGKPADAYPTEFERFWDTYPLKRDKRAALKAWEKARIRASNDELIAGAIRYRNDPNREDQYTKHGATWLNADGWLDEPLPARNAPAQKPGLTTRQKRFIEAELLKDNPDPRALAIAQENGYGERPDRGAAPGGAGLRQQDHRSVNGVVVDAGGDAWALEA